MNDAQKESFYHLLQRPLRPVYGSDLRATGAFGMPGSMAAENEFGDLPWCKACGEHGVKLLNMSVEAGELDLSQFEWVRDVPPLLFDSLWRISGSQLCLSFSSIVLLSTA